MSRPPVIFQRTYVTPATADLRKTYIRDSIVVDPTTADVLLRLPKIGTAFAPVGLRVTIAKPSDAENAVTITPTSSDVASDEISSGAPGAFPNFSATNNSVLPPGQPGSITLEATDMSLTATPQPNPAGGTPTTSGAWLAVGSGTGGGGSAVHPDGPCILYVATTGSDANPGTPALPKSTIQGALNAAGICRNTVTVQVGPGDFEIGEFETIAAGAMFPRAGGSPTTIIQGTYKIDYTFVMPDPSDPDGSEFPTQPAIAPPVDEDLYRGYIMNTVPPLNPDDPNAPENRLIVSSSDTDGTLHIKTPLGSQLPAGTTLILQKPDTRLTFIRSEANSKESEFKFQTLDLVSCRVECTLGDALFTTCWVSGRSLQGFNSHIRLESTNLVGLTRSLGSGNPFVWDLGLSTSGCTLESMFVSADNSFYGDELSDFKNCQVQGLFGTRINLIESSFRGDLYFGGPQVNVQQGSLSALFCTFNGFSDVAIWASESTVKLVDVSGTGSTDVVTVVAPGASGAFTDIDASMDGLQLPQAVIAVTSTVGFPASGDIYIFTNDGGYIAVSYTGIAGNSFTGCTGGSGETLNTANAVLTAIPVAPLTQNFNAGNSLLFLPSGITAVLANSAAIGDTILIPEPLAGAIPAGDTFTASPTAGVRLVDAATYIEEGTSLAADALETLAVTVGSLPTSSRVAVQAGTGVVDLLTLCRAAAAISVP